MWSENGSVVSDSLRPHRLYSPWNSPCQNTGVGSLSLLQGIFPTQGSNPGLPHCGQNLYQLSYEGRILKWVTYPFCRGSSRPRNWTKVSCIAGDSLPAESQGSPSTKHNLRLLRILHDNHYTSGVAKSIKLFSKAIVMNIRSYLKPLLQWIKVNIKNKFLWVSHYLLGYSYNCPS